MGRIPKLLIFLLSRRNRTLYLYMVTATNLSLSDLEPTQRRRTARAGGPGDGGIHHEA